MTLAQRASQANTLSGEPGQQTNFTAFPEGTLLEAGKVPIAEIAELALREGQCTRAECWEDHPGLRYPPRRPKASSEMCRRLGNTLSRME